MTPENSATLPKHICDQIDIWIAKFPADKKKSAVLMALRIVQDEYGYLYKELLDKVASYLELPYVAVYEVASFYSMYKLKPTGKYHLKVCNSISCMLCGSGNIVSYLEKKLNIKRGETTEDGLFTLDYAECLGACCGGPVLIVNDKHYHENMTEDTIDKILDSLQQEGSKNGD